MPLPGGLARFNRRVTNPLMRRISARIPPLATVVHVGRHSGNEYRTPVMAFPTDDGYAFALTYGADVDWVRNVLAAGGGRLVRRHEQVELEDPRLVHGESGARLVAPYTRGVLRALRVDDYLTARVRRAEDT